MASDERRPGAAAGIEQILKEMFEVPTTPNIGYLRALERLQIALGDVTNIKIHLSDGLVERRQLFDASGVRVEFPSGTSFDRCFIALVDFEPNARWAHRAQFAFIPAGETAVEFRDTNLPEQSAGAVRLLPVP
jgi:hypothetical protein